jgi:threonine/homoserine/homoserine lactone efflux protein
MPDAQHLLLFIAAGLLLNLSPGPDVLYIVSNALRSGARAGVVAGLGITAGCFVHVFAAALGVSALLATSAMAFTVLKWVGAAYLVWIGGRLLFARRSQERWGGSDSAVASVSGYASRARSARTPAGSPPPCGHRETGLVAVFRGGFLTNVLNPKVAIFFLAFVPQFIAPETEHKALAFVLLGTLFNINSVAIHSGWALAAAWLARRGLVQRGMHWLDRAAGAMFMGFGLKLALTDNPTA